MELIDAIQKVLNDALNLRGNLENMIREDSRSKDMSVDQIVQLLIDYETLNKVAERLYPLEYKAEHTSKIRAN